MDPGAFTTSRRAGSGLFGNAGRENDDGSADPMLGGRGSVASVLREARASLKLPTRPVTPADHSNARKLFNSSSNQYAARPSSSHGSGPLSRAFRSSSVGNMPQRTKSTTATPSSATMTTGTVDYWRNDNDSSCERHEANAHAQRRMKGVSMSTGTTVAGQPKCRQQKQRPVSACRDGRSVDGHQRNGSSRRRLQPLNPLNPQHHNYHEHMDLMRRQTHAAEEDRAHIARANTSGDREHDGTLQRAHSCPAPGGVHADDNLGAHPPTMHRAAMPVRGHVHEARARARADENVAIEASGVPPGARRADIMSLSSSSSSASFASSEDDFGPSMSADEATFNASMTQLLGKLLARRRGSASDAMIDVVDDMVAKLERARREMEAQGWFARVVDVDALLGDGEDEDDHDGGQTSAAAMAAAMVAAYGGEGVTLRDAVMECMVHLMDARDAQLILKASLAMILASPMGIADRGRAMQRFRRSIRPLWQTLFMLTKNAVNDKLFRRERLLMPLLTILCGTASDGTKTAGSASIGSAFDLCFRVSLLDKVYIAGALKNLAIDENNQTALDRAGAKTALLELLDSIADGDAGDETDAEGGAVADVEELRTQLAVQITSLLRNLLATKEQFTDFYNKDSDCREMSHGHHARSSTAVDVLARLLHRMAGNDELSLNLSRIYSRMSTDAYLCKHTLFGHERSLAAICHCLRAQAHNADVVVRLCYVLGNATEDSNRLRSFLARGAGLVGIVSGLLERYVAKLRCEKAPRVADAPGQHDIDADGDGKEDAHGADDKDALGSGRGGVVGAATLNARGSQSDQQPATMCTTAECLVKQVRLIANLAISPEIGVDIARNESIAESLTSILELCSIPMRRGVEAAGDVAGAGAVAAPDGGRTSGAEEELTLNTVSAVTNITYYDLDAVVDGDVDASSGVPTHRHVNHLFVRSERLGPQFLSLLFCENDEAVVEAARAIGNITRDDDTRARMASMESQISGSATVGRATLEALVILLEHGNRDVVYAVVGCLMNLAADVECYMVLKELDCERHLIDALSWSVLNEIDVACVVMKALYNFRLCRQSGRGEGDADADNDDERDDDIDKAHAIIEILDRVPPPDTKLSGSPSEEDDPEATRAAGSLWALGQQLGKKVHAFLERAMDDGSSVDDDPSGDLEPL